MLNWKRKTSSSEKKFLNRSYSTLSTSHQHKQNWKKPKLERRSWSKAMKNSSKKWSNKHNKHKGWWNKWWRCSKNKPNRSCTTLACFISVICIFTCFCLHICASELLLLTNFYVLLNNVYASELLLCYNVWLKFTTFLTTFFSSLSFFLYFISFCWWQKGE